MNEFSSFSTKQLAELNLARQGNRLKIVIPPDCNIFDMTLGKHLGEETIKRPALIFETPDGQVQTQSFGDVDTAATALAAFLSSLGYGFGDYIGVHTGQHPDTAIAHMAICKIGGVAVTLSQLYGPDTLAHAMNDSKTKILLTGAKAWEPLRKDAQNLFPNLAHVVLRDPGPGELDLESALNFPSFGFVPEYGNANDPALLMYTSGSTGKPKGILHGHRVLAAYTPSIHLFFNLEMDPPAARYWSPSDWAWVGGLLDMLFPAWMAGRPVVTSLDRFKADWAYEFMARHKITHTFLAPTAIKRLAQTPEPRTLYDLSLKVICTGGEALAADTLDWAERKLGVVCNEFYGMTEVNHLVGNCAALFPRRAGSMGRAYPGHEVYLVDGEAKQVADGETGEIVTSADAPTKFLGYHNNRGKEDEMKLGSYLRTHDLAVRDEDGYFWYKGRSDDLIKSSGFRIGPAEIEECLIAHADVAEAAVIGKPDVQRGAIVKAFIKTRAGCTPDLALTAVLKEHVRQKLAAYKAPREIEFVDKFELTSSGKINRRALREAEHPGKGDHP